MFCSLGSSLNLIVIEYFWLMLVDYLIAVMLLQIMV